MKKRFVKQVLAAMLIACTVLSSTSNVQAASKSNATEHNKIYTYQKEISERDADLTDKEKYLGTNMTKAEKEKAIKSLTPTLDMDKSIDWVAAWIKDIQPNYKIKSETSSQIIKNWSNCYMNDYYMHMTNGICNTTSFKHGWLSTTILHNNGQYMSNNFEYGTPYMEALKIGVTGFDMEVYYKNSNGKWTKDKNHSISAKLGKYVNYNQDALDAFGITDDIRDNCAGASLKELLALDRFDDKCDNSNKYDYTKYFKNGTKTWATSMEETNKGEYKIKIRLWGSPNGKKVYSKWTSVLLTKPSNPQVTYNDKTKKATIKVIKGSNYETKYYVYASASVNVRPQTSEEFAAYGKTVIYPYKFAYVTSKKASSSSKTTITVPYKSELGSISATHFSDKSWEGSTIIRQYMVVAESVIDGEKVYSFSWTNYYNK